MLPPVAKELAEYFQSLQAHAVWDPERTERANIVVPTVLQHVKGDILEIGALRGKTTAIFCQATAQYEHRVFVIDPWDGRQQGDAALYNEFTANTKGFDNLIVHRMGSENPDARKLLLEAKAQFAFILIDGLHTYDAVRNDITQYVDLLLPNGVLCIDDWRGPYGFCEDIRRAARDHLGSEIVEIPTPDVYIEQYFVKEA